MTAAKKDGSDDRYEIRLGGSGGQGIILAAVILAEAAAIHGGYQVCQSQSYGPEARGGRCKAEVVVATGEIDYPQVIMVDILLALTQEACDAYFHNFKPNGLLLADSTFVKQLPTSRVISLPFTRIAMEKTGKAMTTNMVALGAVGVVNRLITTAHLEKAIQARSPHGSAQVNLQAFRAGVKATKALDLSKLPRSVSPEEEDEV
ncbi:MAG: 2-oxoacid:acceptor oxidoreductase family protein [Proteobacteria bacterium]|nr:2-oxoacid:acceptor oxidoreductase family protein [Pseudomonadota bacterium]MBU1687722.1 2-oxoacid:acceptor oxidoreductase family protein [Pseudomonadota bacterium]